MLIARSPNKLGIPHGPTCNKQTHAVNRGLREKAVVPAPALCCTHARQSHLCLAAGLVNERCGMSPVWRSFARLLRLLSPQAVRLHKLPGRPEPKKSLAQEGKHLLGKAPLAGFPILEGWDGRCPQPASWIPGGGHIWR